jgi:neutral ceramidase
MKPSAGGMLSRRCPIGPGRWIAGRESMAPDFGMPWSCTNALWSLTQRHESDVSVSAAKVEAMRTTMRLLVVICWVLSFSESLSAQELRAGVATVDITPPVGYAMWGYGARHDKPSVGVLDPLHARALVLDTGGERIAIVALDLGRAPPRQSTAVIEKAVKSEAGVNHIFLVGSHTHHGPVIEVDTWPNPEHSYVRDLEKKLSAVIVEAAKSLQPARLGIASKEVPYNRNRHTKREPPVDREFLVLRIDSMDGKPIAYAVNFAAHPTMYDAKMMKFSADFPGALSELVQKETGAPCLFLQGAAGDMSTNRGSAPGPVEYGQMLGREVLALARTIQSTSPKEGTLQVAEDTFRFKSRVDLKNPAIRMIFVKAFYPDLEAFYEREYKEGVRPRMTTALLDGRIGIVGVSGEFFCGHSLALKRRARLEHVLFLGYCNDYQQYFPTIEAASEGGYGAEAGVSTAEVGAGERMIDRALIHLYKMRGKLGDLRVGRISGGG